MKFRIRNFAFIALAALALTTTPHRAYAAVDTYLTVDGGGGGEAPSPTPRPPNTWWSALLSIVGL